MTLVKREVRLLEGLGYIVVQILGGLCGVALANIMFDLPAFDPSTNARSGFPIWLGEVVATAGLIAIIGVLTRTGRGHPRPDTRSSVDRCRLLLHIVDILCEPRP